MRTPNGSTDFAASAFNVRVCGDKPWPNIRFNADPQQAALRLLAVGRLSGPLDEHMPSEPCGRMKRARKQYRTAGILALMLIVQSLCFANTERGLEAMRAGDFDRAKAEFAAAAEKELDRQAQFHLARMYQRAIGTKYNCEKAAELFLKSAEQRYFPAMLSVVEGYAFGRNCMNSDQGLASLWFERARTGMLAAGDDVIAIRSLAVLYTLLGHKDEAHRWYAKLAQHLIPKAEADDANAQAELASLYARGDGVSVDAMEARKWRLKAAKGGNADAQFFVGAQSKNPQERLAWWRKAVNQGHSWAMYRLGMALLEGQDAIPRNEEEGMHWVREAARRGVDYAREVLRKRESTQR